MKDISEKQFIKLVPFVFIVVLAGDILLGIYLEEIGVAIVNGILTAGLVLVTCVYALHTKTMAEEMKTQADANVKMATEMKNQRYDMVRPVIDIKINEGHPKPTDKVEFKIVHYTPINVGVGPSIDGYSYMQSADGDITYHSELGTISAHDEHPGFSIKLDNNNLPTTLIAYYRDVHGRSFESKRQISQPEKDKALSFGKLEHRKLDKNEDIITRIWPSK